MAVKSAGRLQVPLDAGMRAKIEQAAREADVSLAQIMRQAIRYWIAHCPIERQQKGQQEGSH